MRGSKAWQLAAEIHVVREVVTQCCQSAGKGIVAPLGSGRYRGGRAAAPAAPPLLPPPAAADASTTVKSTCGRLVASAVTLHSRPSCDSAPRTMAQGSTR